jgi:hypothetical protein
MAKSRKLTVELDRLLDLVVAVQMDGLDTVHEFLGGMVGQLSDAEVHAFVQTLRDDGYSRRDLDEADCHLRTWRQKFVKVARGVKSQDFTPDRHWQDLVDESEEMAPKLVYYGGELHRIFHVAVGGEEGFET